MITAKWSAGQMTGMARSGERLRSSRIHAIRGSGACIAGPGTRSCFLPRGACDRPAAGFSRADTAPFERRLRHPNSALNNPLGGGIHGQAIQPGPRVAQTASGLVSECHVETGSGLADPSLRVAVLGRGGQTWTPGDLASTALAGNRRHRVLRRGILGRGRELPRCPSPRRDAGLDSNGDCTPSPCVHCDSYGAGPDHNDRSDHDGHGPRDSNHKGDRQTDQQGIGTQDRSSIRNLSRGKRTWVWAVPARRRPGVLLVSRPRP